jgi:hypothetical protein
MTNFRSVTTAEEFPMKIGDLLVIKGGNPGNLNRPTEFYRVGTEIYVSKTQKENKLSSPPRRALPTKGYLHPIDRIQHLTGWVSQYDLDQKGDFEPEPVVEVKRPKRDIKPKKPREYGQILY